MDIVFLIGRIIFGLIFIIFGVNHFTGHKETVGYAQSKGIKGANFFVPLTGLMLVLGGLSVGFGFLPRIGLILIILFLLPTSFLIHNFWSAPEDQRQGQMIEFMKNAALIGASLALLYIPLPWPLSL
ncbi:MAG: DoxX family membrane protein [Candidatus Paceibacterota bacterium]